MNPFLPVSLAPSIKLHATAQDRAKFDPLAGKQLFIIGQDLGAIGGFESPNNNGYCDHLDIRPGGVTTYTALTQLHGLDHPTNYGSGDVCAQKILDNPIYNQSVLVVGLALRTAETSITAGEREDELESIAAGKHDDQIYLLAKWIKRARRPVFLRIGFEFDGSWNNYDPDAYKKVFRKIVSVCKEMQVTNCATVWQAATSPWNANNNKDINDWYPGDRYVDWVGYSWFQSSPETVQLTDKMLAFALAHHKPVMVCESTPQGYDTINLTFREVQAGKNSRAKMPEQIWNEWYVPFFNYIEENKDLIKAVAYINVNWDVQAIWGFPYKVGYWGDSRVEVNPVIKTKWIEAISQPKWMFSSPTLFSDLGFTEE